MISMRKLIILSTAGSGVIGATGRIVAERLVATILGNIWIV
jgi:hypothetical protein